MPWARYFLCVGGVLLALMFISDALLPKDAVEVKPVSDHPAIRIHSDRKWPERVVFDTNRPTIVPPQSATVTAGAPTPVPSELTGKAARNAYAALDTPDPKQAQLSDPAKLEKKLQRKRRIAKRRVAPPMMVAQQPQFGLFGNSWNSTW